MTPLTDEIKSALIATVSKWQDTDLEDYIKPERGRPGEISLVLKPADEAELQALIIALNEHKIGTTTFAGKSGLVEAQRPHGVGIDMQRFNHIFSLTLADGTEIAPADFATIPEHYTTEQLRGAKLHVGAGVTIDAINEALAKAGLKLPIVMGSTDSATAGACAANGSAGANAIRYGTAADMALHLRGVLGTGEIVEQTVTRRPPVTDPEACIIRSDRFSHGNSLVGSQGALGLITEVTYEVFPVSKAEAIVLLPVPDPTTALALLSQVKMRFTGDQAVEQFEIIRKETLDKAELHCRERDGKLEDILAKGLDREAPYFVLLHVTSLTGVPTSGYSSFTDEMATYVMSAALGRDGKPLYEEGQVHFEEDIKRLMDVREACSEMSRPLDKQSYDIVVPVKYLDVFVDELEAAMAEQYPQFTLSVFGHGGVGALHIHTIAPDKETLEKHRAALDKLVFDLVQKHKGSPWAEHGVGSKWGEEWQRRTPKEVIDEMLDIKRECDPNNVIGSRLFRFDLLMEKERGADGTEQGAGRGGSALRDSILEQGPRPFGGTSGPTNESRQP